MSYVMSKILWKVRWLYWNHEPCFVDLDSEQLTPATFFRHRHLNPPGIVGSVDHVISRSQVLHCTLLRSRPTSFRNCIAKPWSQNTYVAKFLLGRPSSRSIGRPYEDLGTNDIFCRRFSYSFTTSQRLSTIVCWNETKATAHDGFGAKNGCYTGTGSVQHCGWYIKTRGGKVNGIQVEEWKPEETKRKWIMNFNYTNSLKPNLTFVRPDKRRR